MVRIKTERHLLKAPAILESKPKLDKKAGLVPEKATEPVAERPIEIIIDGPCEQSSPKE